MHAAHRAEFSSTTVTARREREPGHPFAHPAHWPDRTHTMLEYTLELSRTAWSRITAPLTVMAAIALLSMAPHANAQILIAGGFHNCALTAAGGVVCWGGNDTGQLGDGTIITRSKPVNVSGLPFGSTALAAGHGSPGHTCAVTGSGGVKCWGGNGNGQLGDNSTTQRLTPVDVSGLSSISRVSAGDRFSCALSTTGGIHCWGRNNSGQLGDGTAPADGSAPNQLVPGTVSGFGPMAGATALAGSYNHACAVNSTGGAVCWGANFGMQLGDGSSVNFRNAPVNVTGLASGVTAVATGSDHSCALTTTGGMKCWGDNFFGELGIGTSGLPSPAPVDVSGLTSGVIAITAGQFHTCALTTGGGVKCWGSNAQGQIGDGTNTQRNAPVEVYASGAIAVAAGANHTCALFSTGSSTCWGNNPNGQIGNGTIGGSTYVPVATIYPAATATALVSGLNPSIFGDNVTFTATVTGGVDGTAVTFQNGGINIAGCSAQTLASGTASCTTSVLAGGTYSITAIYQGTATTLASQSAAISQVVNKADQTITFDTLSNKTLGDPPFSIAATASSGLAVTFTSTTLSVCTVSGTTVTIVTTGTCTIDANQAGSANFNAALAVSQSFSISGAPSLALLAVVSRRTHGAAGPFELPINAALPINGAITVDSRSIGTGHKIVFKFDSTITSTGAASSVDSASMPLGTVMPVASGNEVIVTLTGIPDNRRATISLTNVNGAAVNVSASMGFLVGDVNSSRSVNISDVNGVKLRSSQTTSATNFRFDVNGSGVINISDVNATKLRSGLTLTP